MDLVKRVFSSRYDLLDKIEWVEGDLLDSWLIPDWLEGVDHVYHCAAWVSLNASDHNLMMKINVQGTADLMNVCLGIPGIHVCHVSSVAAIGRELENGIVHEETEWDGNDSKSYYTISKHESEREVWRAIAEGLQAVIVNPSVVLGEGNWKTDSSRIFGMTLKGNPFYTRGTTGFVDVCDLTNIMIRLIGRNISGQRYIVSAGELTYQELLSSISSFLTIKPPSILLRKWHLELLWRLDSMACLLLKRNRKFTHAIAQVAVNNRYFSNNKIRKTLNFEFKPLGETLREVSRACLAG
jgi:dihydroflavonol-4-reductase